MAVQIDASDGWQNGWRELAYNQYRWRIKAAVDAGHPVDGDGVELPDLKRYITRKKNQKAKKEKEIATIFGTEGDTRLLEQYGVKIKTQSGAPLTNEQVEEIRQNLDEQFFVLGDISDILRESGLTIVHTEGGNVYGKNSSCAGQYDPSHKTVFFGKVMEGTDTSYPGFGHELAHFLDYEAGTRLGKQGQIVVRNKKGREVFIDYSLINNEKNYYEYPEWVSNARETYTTSAKVEITGGYYGYKALRNLSYWNTPAEMFARLCEQYTARKLAKKGYEKAPQSVRQSYEESLG
jgi:hypothetical protein